MKLLRNPVAVAVLAVLAVGLVVKSLWPMLQGTTRRRTPSPPPAAAAPTPAPRSPAPASPAPVGSMALERPAPLDTNGLSSPLSSDINLDLVRQDAPRWAKGRRDPFAIRSIPSKPVYPRAMEVLRLSAVWRQTDHSLAVLNDHIYAAGDIVLRFTIKSIEPDRVWVQGPNGREVVVFHTAILATNGSYQGVVNANLAPGVPVSP